jgi:phosphoserine phosphatase
MSAAAPPRIVLQGRWLSAALAQQVATLSGASRLQQRSATVWTCDGLAGIPGAATWARIRACADAARVDVNCISAPRPLASFKLAVMDMDSTLITIECIDEIADMQGLKPQVAAITEAAMRGEIAYPESLRRRVALLQGLDVSALHRVYNERLQLSPGVEAMLAGFRAAGLKTLLVSGGFTFFTEKLKARLGIDFTHSNVLGIDGNADSGRLTGTVTGTIVDAEEKARMLVETCARIGCTPADAIAIGDGANDLAMMAVAGLSVAYRAKPVVRAQALTAISHNGLDAVLPFFD